MTPTLLDHIIAVAVSANFLAFASGAAFKLKSRTLGPASVFTVVQVILFVTGWGLARLLVPMLTGHEDMLFNAILLFLGAKRIVRFFSVKKEARAFQLVHIFDVAGVSTAVAIDALIFGLGFGMIAGELLPMTFMMAAYTLLMGVTGILIREKFAPKDNGAIAELLSGITLLLTGMYILIL